MAAAQLGYRCHIYAPEADSIAAEVSARVHQCRLGRPRGDGPLRRRLRGDHLRVRERAGGPAGRARPGAGAAAPARAGNRAGPAGGKALRRASLAARPRPSRRSTATPILPPRSRQIGAPGILKTRRDGYDGKGQWRIKSLEDAAALDLPTTPLIYEGFVDFAAEFSVILCRGADGDDPLLGQRRERPRGRHSCALHRAGLAAGARASARGAGAGGARSPRRWTMSAC